MPSENFKQRLALLYKFLSNRLGIDNNPAPKVILVNNEENAKNPYGFTGHYNPQNKTITLYITDRHDTDILRSFAHEVIHLLQDLRGRLIP